VNATKAFGITILAAPLTVSPDTLPDATAGITYSVGLAVNGGTPPFTWFLPVVHSGGAAVGSIERHHQRHPHCNWDVSVHHSSD